MLELMREGQVYELLLVSKSNVTPPLRRKKGGSDAPFQALPWKKL
ncbi:hypothetical protein [Thermococcus sp. JCM 11816]